jgi:predicted DNA-binding WGR domain protein
MKNYFEYQDEKSAKFWEITVEGTTLKTRYGKIGTTGQTTEKVFADEAAVQKEYAKLVKEKTGKGYVEIGAQTNDKPKKIASDKNNKGFNALLFNEALEKYNLHFLPDYIIEKQNNNSILIFEDDAHFESLEIDPYAATNKVDALFFLKDLTAKNYIIQKEMDYGPTVIVMGNVQAKNIWCSGGDIYFKGNVTAEQSLIAGVYNHGELSIDGDIQAELVLSQDHMFNYKTISKGVVVGIEVAYKEPDFQIYEAQDALAKKYLEQGEYVDIGKIYNGVKKGESLLKSAKPNTPLQRQFEKSEKTGFTKLDLSDLNLKEVPDAVFELTNLKELHLDGNLLTNLPDAIKQLKNLEKLNISRCYFEIFPAVIFELTQLTSLNIAQNQIAIIPPEISNLQALKELNLYNCGLNEFPESLYDLQALEDLNCSYLKDLAKKIVSINKPFKNLKKLNLYANRGAQIEVALPELVELNLRNCAMMSMPEILVHSTKLKKLDLTLNRSMTLPEAFKNLTSLSDLSISLTIKNVSIIQYLPKLKKLVVHFEHNVADNIEDILLNPHWTELGIEGSIQDKTIWRKILSRPNLKKLEEVHSSGNREMNIQEGRKELNVKI